MLIGLIASLCVAITSIASAQRMAPVEGNSPEIQAYLATGGSISDLCADDLGSHDDHDCPFCRLLAEADDPAPAAQTWVLSPNCIQWITSDLAEADQSFNARAPVRGPPVFG